MTEPWDVVIIGGGPAGLSAALALGRARRKVAILDRGPRRNARAEHMHNFVTRDGITPDTFRAIGHEQLLQYPSVTHRQSQVTSVQRTEGVFHVTTDTGTLDTRRVLLCTGLIDEPLAIEGAAELWGHAIFQCPYCHGWENRDLRWGYLLHSPDRAAFAMMLRSWSSDITVFVHHQADVPQADLDLLGQRGIRVESRRIDRLLFDSSTAAPRLRGIAMTDGSVVGCDVIFAHPEQRQVPLVLDLGVALDENGLVAVDAMTRQTSLPGVYAAGDLATRMQGAIFAAAAGTQAAAMINHELAMT